MARLYISRDRGLQIQRDSRFNLLRRLESRQALSFVSVTEQRQRRRLPQPQFPEERLTQHLQLHPQQGRALPRHTVRHAMQRHFQHPASRALVLVEVHQHPRVLGQQLLELLRRGGVDDLHRCCSSNGPGPHRSWPRWPRHGARRAASVRSPAAVLLPPLCLAGSEHRQLPRPLAALGDAGHPRLHFRRRAAGVVGPAAEQHQVGLVGRQRWRLAQVIRLLPVNDMTRSPAAPGNLPATLAGGAAQRGRHPQNAPPRAGLSEVGLGLGEIVGVGLDPRHHVVGGVAVQALDAEHAGHLVGPVLHVARHLLHVDAVDAIQHFRRPLGLQLDGMLERLVHIGGQVGGLQLRVLADDVADQLADELGVSQLVAKYAKPE
ncbi:hypothetical protein G6F31_014306 [Rhizopus arrhizus]|nr:hypothetical protein G6F31_014306 [Rhizopus arrhizus]